MCVLLCYLFTTAGVVCVWGGYPGLVTPVLHTVCVLFFTLTLPFSTHWVTITTLCTFCSHTIFQKSSLVPGSGPCVATYSLRKLLPYELTHNTKVIFSMWVSVCVWVRACQCWTSQGCNWRWCSLSKDHRPHRRALLWSSRLRTRSTRWIHSLCPPVCSVCVCMLLTGEDVVVSIFATILRQQSWVQGLSASDILQVLTSKSTNLVTFKLFAWRLELGVFYFRKPTHLVLVRQQVVWVRLQFNEVGLKVLDLDGAEGDKVS